MKTMKISILIMALSLGSFATSTAAMVNNNVQTEQEPAVDQDKQEIAMKDLPEAAQKDVKANYPEAKFVTAYKSADAAGNAKYEVLLNNGGKELKLWYDAEGNAVK